MAEGVIECLLNGCRLWSETSIKLWGRMLTIVFNSSGEAIRFLCVLASES